jgi:hypothetical protein
MPLESPFSRGRVHHPETTDTEVLLDKDPGRRLKSTPYNPRDSFYRGADSFVLPYPNYLPAGLTELAVRDRIAGRGGRDLRSPIAGVQIRYL